MKERKRKLTIRLTDKTYTSLKVISEADGFSLQDEVLLAIKNLTAKRRQIAVKLPSNSAEGEKSPHTPLIRNSNIYSKREREKRAGAREEFLDLDEQDCRTPPTSIEDAVLRLQKYRSITNKLRGQIAEWWQERNAHRWCDKSGKKIANWYFDFDAWLQHYDANKKTCDPGRIPDARLKGLTRKEQAEVRAESEKDARAKIALEAINGLNFL